MKCVKCSKTAEINLPYLSACTSCFLKIIEKRVRKELRVNRLIEKDDCAIIIDDSSPAAAVNMHLMKIIFDTLPLSISVKKAGYSLGKEIRGKFNKAIIPWTQDDENNYFLSCIYNNKQPNFTGHFTLKGKIYIKPLLFVTEEECMLVAKAKSLKFSHKPRESILSELEAPYPEIRFNLNKNIQELKKIINTP